MTYFSLLFKIVTNMYMLDLKQYVNKTYWYSNILATGLTCNTAPLYRLLWIQSDVIFQ